MADDQLTSVIRSALAGAEILPQVKFHFDAQDVGAATWGVRSLSLEEELSGLYLCALELKSETPGADPSELEGASCVIRIERGNEVRRVCGVVCQVKAHGWMVDYTLARVEVRPALALLGLTQGARIFQQMSAADIVQQVLSEGLKPYKRTVRLALSRDYLEREYCTQYQESDLDFALRLMAEDGMFFRFDHSGELEELVVVDLNDNCPELPQGPVPIVARETPAELLPSESIGTFTFSHRLQATEVVLRDHGWTSPDVDFTAPPRGNSPRKDARGRVRELYRPSTPNNLIRDYDPGRKKYVGDESPAYRKLALERVQARTRLAEGESNAIALVPGAVLEISGHNGPGMDGRYLLTSVRHEGQAADEIHFQMSDVKSDRDRYRNAFTCIPLDLPYRPEARLRPAPMSPQTATVVGPEGEEIHTDEHGRIKVQFHWDREGKKDDRSSCWVRVAQAWAGPGWGFVFIPRVGMEVVVQFLQGDPDRPLVTGCVYNGANPPPYPLPDKKTQSTVKTASSPGSNGFNELRFEDAKDEEEVFLHAQRDMNEVVKRNHSASVGGSQSVSVGGDQSISVNGNQTVTVKGGGSGAVHSKVDITGKHQLDASDTIAIQAPTSISLTCGGSSVVIEPGKITLTAGDGSKIVLDANALMQSSQGSKVLLDANACTESSAGAKTLHDANVLSQSVPGSKVLLDASALVQSTPGARMLLDANALVAAVPGASMVLDANATVSAPANATVKGGPQATVTAAVATLAGGGGSVEAGPAGVTAAGGKVSLSGGMVDIAGGLVKIN